MFIAFDIFSINITEDSNPTLPKEWTLQSGWSQSACLSQAQLHFEPPWTWVSVCYHHRSLSLYKNCITVCCKCAQKVRWSQKFQGYLFSLGTESPAAHSVIIMSFPLLFWLELFLLLLVWRCFIIAAHRFPDYSWMHCKCYCMYKIRNACEYNKFLWLCFIKFRFQGKHFFIFSVIWMQH